VRIVELLRLAYIDDQVDLVALLRLVGSAGGTSGTVERAAAIMLPKVSVMSAPLRAGWRSPNCPRAVVGSFNDRA